MKARGKQSKLKKTHSQDQRRQIGERTAREAGVLVSRYKDRLVQRSQCPDCLSFISNVEDHVC